MTLDISNAESLMTNVNAWADGILGAGSQDATGPGSTGNIANEDMKDMLEDLMAVLQQMIDKLGGGSSSAPGSDDEVSDPISNMPIDMEPIAGSGRIWGDPHFIGQDGGKYDVQGEAGKTYNLLSDQNFQMNGRFDQYKDKDGLTVVGAVGISAGADQISVEKDGTVMVNNQELEAGETVELADGGSVTYHANGGSVAIDSGEWQTDIQFQNKGTSNRAHLNIDVSTENAVADGVRPHGLLGQTFDADDEARNGDKGKGTQGGGAIEGADGQITERGDRSAVELYEVDGLYDRNGGSDFNQFFDTAEANLAQYDAELQAMMQRAMGMLAQMMTMVLAGNMNQS